MSASREQTKALRQYLIISFLKMLIVYLVFWLCVVLVYRFLVRDRVAEYIVEHTAETFEIPVEEYDKDVLVYNPYMRVTYNDGTNVTVQYLYEYESIRSMKYPVAVGAFLLGIAGMLLILLRRSLRYFEELGDGVTDMVVHRREPVRLSGDLAIMQSELNEMREAMLDNERTVRESERRKNELVAYLAHDLRTPLTSVVGYLHLLVEARNMPEEQRQEYLETALDKAETLDDLTGEFFEITRYNLSSIPIERNDVEIDFFLEQVVDQFYPELQARSIEANVSAPAGETCYIDSDKMARAVGNVVRNAIAYANTGTTVDICATHPASGMGWQITVTDQGQEIAPAHLERIFDQFMRVDSARQQSGHAGLGLAIAREIVQAHGGSIRAESANGTTTFTIELP